MFSIELKFAIDPLLKRFYNIYISSFFEIDVLKKQKYEKSRSIEWFETKWFIYSLEILAGSSFGLLSKQMSFYDFAVKKEHLFLSNI